MINVMKMNKNPIFWSNKNDPCNVWSLYMMKILMKRERKELTWLGWIDWGEERSELNGSDLKLGLVLIDFEELNW